MSLWVIEKFSYSFHNKQKWSFHIMFKALFPTNVNKLGKSMLKQSILSISYKVLAIN